MSEALLLTQRIDRKSDAVWAKRFAWVAFDLIVFAGIILFLG